MCQRYVLFLEIQQGLMRVLRLVEVNQRRWKKSSKLQMFRESITKIPTGTIDKWHWIEKARIPTKDNVLYHTTGAKMRGHKFLN